MSENEINVNVNKNSFASAGFVLSIIAFIFSFIPLINYISIIMGFLAVVFGLIGLAKKINKGKAIAAIILGIISITISYNALVATGEALNKASKKINDSIDQINGNNTDTILEKELDVVFGNFEYKVNDLGYGYKTETTALPVTFTNKSAKQKSFSVEIEAVDASGNRITTDIVYVNNLNAGQSYETKCFVLVSNGKANQLQGATFKVLKVSSY